MTDLRKAAQAVVAALEKAPYLRHEAIDALRAALAQPEQQAEPSIVVGHSVDRGGWCVYESTGSGEYACLLGPFATKDEADAAAHPPAQPPQPEQQATTDQLIDLSEELQKLRALHIAGAVRALRSPGDAPTPFDAGYDLACEEIAHRLAHEEWELNDDGWGPVGAHPPEQPSEFEVRKDGKTVRKDRWEWGVRRIVALLWGNRHEFEVDEVVDAVAALVPNPHNDGDDETLVASAQVGFAPQPDPQAYGLVLMMRNVRRLQRHMDEWQSWYGAADVLLRNQLPLPPAGTVGMMEDLDESIKAAHPPAQPIEPGNLYWRLHSLSKVLESSGRIDEHEQKGAYATILDAMNHVRSKP